MGFLRAVCSVSARIALKLAADDGMIPMEHSSDAAHAFMTAQKEFDFFPLIEGEFLSSHRGISSLDMSQRAIHWCFERIEGWCIEDRMRGLVKNS